MSLSCLSWTYFTFGCINMQSRVEGLAARFPLLRASLCLFAGMTEVADSSVAWSRSWGCGQVLRTANCETFANNYSVRKCRGTSMCRHPGVSKECIGCWIALGSLIVLGPEGNSLLKPMRCVCWPLVPSTSNFTAVNHLQSFPVNAACNAHESGTIEGEESLC